jgi:shikimate dehydrogenase
MTALINGSTKLYGIIGNPVNHSLSPAMHNAAFSVLAENKIYLPFPVEDVQMALAGLKALNIQGVSVTIPHKETVIPFLDRIDPVALKIGAVNTIDIRFENGKKVLCGFNTDWLGANRALTGKMELQGAMVILLGAGGAARAIGFGLKEAGAGVVLCSRTESTGKALAAELSCTWFPLRDAENLRGDALVNATSVGMTPREGFSPVVAGKLSSYQVVMDIVYAPLQTRLLREAEAAGCRIISGLEMLLYQGVAQFELWTGLSAPVEVMRAALLAETRKKEEKAETAEYR